MAAEPSSESLRKGLIGFWRFEDPTVDAFEDSSGNFEAAVSSQYLKPDAALVPGKVGQALAFSGRGRGWGAGIEIEKAAADPKKNQFSMAFWVRPMEWNANETPDDPLTPWGRNEFARIENQFLLSLSKDDDEHAGAIQFRINRDAAKEGTWPVRSAPYTLPLKEWTFVVWTYDAEKGGQLFINGEREGRTICDPADAELFGKAVGGTDAFQGRFGATSANVELDEFAFWERALDDEEVAWLFNEGKGRDVFSAP